MKAPTAIFIAIIAFLMPLHALSEPSKLITNLMKTPASAFDVFLFHIKQRGQCFQTYWGNPGGLKFDLCLTTVEYSFDDNIIEMSFFVGKRYKLLHGMSGMTQMAKKNRIKKVLIKASQAAGVEKSGPLGYFGLIQTVPIRHGWSTNNLNEKKIKEEIRKRTRVVLYTEKIDGRRYRAVRSHHGEITIFNYPNNKTTK